MFLGERVDRRLIVIVNNNQSIICVCSQKSFLTHHHSFNTYYAFNIYLISMYWGMLVHIFNPLGNLLKSFTECFLYFQLVKFQQVLNCFVFLTWYGFVWIELTTYLFTRSWNNIIHYQWIFLQLKILLLFYAYNIS